MVAAWQNVGRAIRAYELARAPPSLQAAGSAVIDFAVSGSNYGTAANAVADGWTPEEQAIDLQLAGVPCPSAARGVIGSVNVIECTMRVTTAGPKNISLSVAGQSTFMADTDANAPTVACDWGLVGGIGQQCLPCPTGALCVGYDRTLPGNDTRRFADPVPLPGFYNLNGEAEGGPEDVSPVWGPAPSALFPR